MNTTKGYVLAILWVAGTSLCIPITSQANVTPLVVKQPVQYGQGTLSWWGFDLYTATYFGPPTAPPSAKTFPGWEPGNTVRLSIEYHKSISAEQLINATTRIWRKMGVNTTNETIYVEQLKRIWKDVKAGDVLTLNIDSQGKSTFDLNDIVLGEINSNEFSSAFIGIWTSPNSPNTELRNSLLGFNN
jgi:hypothetical protein